MFRKQIIERNGTRISLQYTFYASFKIFRIIKQREFYALQSLNLRGAGLVLKKNIFKVLSCFLRLVYFCMRDNTKQIQSHGQNARNVFIRSNTEIEGSNSIGYYEKQRNIFPCPELNPIYSVVCPAVQLLFTKIMNQ